MASGQSRQVPLALKVASGTPCRWSWRYVLGLSAPRRPSVPAYTARPEARRPGFPGGMQFRSLNDDRRAEVGTDDRVGAERQRIQQGDPSVSGELPFRVRGTEDVVLGQPDALDVRSDLRQRHRPAVEGHRW